MHSPKPSRVDTRRATRVEGLESRTLLAADLSAAISFVSPPSHQVKPGKIIGIAIEIFNTGDALAAGKLTTTLGVSLNADGSASIPEGSLVRRIHLLPGRHVTFHVKTKVPIGFAPGLYFATADVDPANTFGETNVANNFAVSANTITVLPPFPDLNGTWSGPIVVKRGTGKGPAGTQVDIFTGESQTTGAFTYTGTNFLLDGQTLQLAGAGTVTTKGLFKDSGTDVPVDSLGVETGTGKVVGNKLVIKFANAINSGILTLTRQ